MAQMIPNSLTYYNFTESEKTLYNALKLLSDHYTVFYSVPWQSKTNDGNFRFDGECDFIIENKNLGFLTIEVKGGKGLKLDKNGWHLYISDRELNDSDEYIDSEKQFVRPLRRSPAVQARESMYYFRDHFKDKYNHNYSGVFGYATCFPNFLIKEDLGPDSPPETIIDSSSMGNIPEKIESIFKYYAAKKPIQYKAEDHADFLKMIALKRHFDITKGSIIRSRIKIFETVNRAQDFYLAMLSEYKRACITGGAGTGKTFCAIKKAKKLALDNKRVLFLCFNRLLAEHLKMNHFLDIHGLDCYIFHDFIQNIMGKQDFQKLFSVTKGSLEGVSKIINNGQYALPKYDSVIIDEGQDYCEEWYNCVDLLFKNKEDAFFYVFYDKYQDIFEANADRITRRFKYPPFHLTESLRNCAEIQKWVTDKTGYGTDVVPNQIEGVEPIIFEAKSKESAISLLKSILNALLNEELIESNQIVVVSDRKLENSILRSDRNIDRFRLVDLNIMQDPNQNNIRFVTAQSFKGLESDIVIYLQHETGRGEHDKMLQYVAYTRARFILYVIKCSL